MTTIITVTNQKGGVGKTSTVLNLASQLACSGRQVLIADFDPQGQCAIGLGLNPEPGAFNLMVNTGRDPREFIRAFLSGVMTHPCTGQTMTVEAAACCGLASASHDRFLKLPSK